MNDTILIVQMLKEINKTLTILCDKIEQKQIPILYVHGEGAPLESEQSRWLRGE